MSASTSISLSRLSRLAAILRATFARLTGRFTFTVARPPSSTRTRKGAAGRPDRSLLVLLDRLEEFDRLFGIDLALFKHFQDLNPLALDRASLLRLPERPFPWR